MIASRLGLEVDAEQLLRRFALQSGEPETPTLIGYALELGLEAKSVHMSFHDLPRVAGALPAILRAKGGRALILEEARADHTKGTVAVIRDPSVSEDALLAIDELHLAEVWEGEVILIKHRRSAPDERQPFGLGWLWGQLLRERKLFRHIIIAALISTIFAIAPPVIFRVVLDRVLVDRVYPTLNVVCVGVLLLIIFETGLGYLSRVLTAGDQHAHRWAVEPLYHG